MQPGESKKLLQKPTDALFTQTMNFNDLFDNKIL